MTQTQRGGVAVGAALLALGVWAGSAGGGLLVADSVAEFSGTQGQNGWYYGYFNVSSHGDGYHATPGGRDDFQPLPWYGTDATGRWDPWPHPIGWQYQTTFNPWTLLTANEAHPNGADSYSGSSTNVHWAVRRYVNETAGDLQIDWHLAKDDITYGNGVTGRVFVNGVQVDSILLSYNNSTGVDRTVTVPAVPLNAYVDLVLDATGTFSMSNGGAGNGQDDLSFMTAKITLVPEPASLSLLGVSILLLLPRRRHG